MSELTCILHLTDLHLGSTLDFDHERIIDALCDDLTRQVSDGVVFDFCVFTGDIVKTGEEDHFELALDQLLKIAEAAGIDEKRIILCPGNHDADRRIIGENLPSLAGFRKIALKREGANTLSMTADFNKYTAAAFACFNDLADEFGKDAIVYRDAFCTVYFLRSASVVSINTAILTATGLTPDLADRGQLFFPEQSLVRALKECPEGVPKIVCGHHPLEYLNDIHAAMLTRILTEASSTYLCGHLHDPSPQTH